MNTFRNIDVISDSIKETNSRYEIGYIWQYSSNFKLTPTGLRNIKKLTACQYDRQDYDVITFELNKLL